MLPQQKSYMSGVLRERRHVGDPFLDVVSKASSNPHSNTTEHNRTPPNLSGQSQLTHPSYDPQACS